MSCFRENIFPEVQFRLQHSCPETKNVLSCKTSNSYTFVVDFLIPSILLVIGKKKLVDGLQNLSESSRVIYGKTHTIENVSFGSIESLLL